MGDTGGQSIGCSLLDVQFCFNLNKILDSPNHHRLEISPTVDFQARAKTWKNAPTRSTASFRLAMAWAQVEHKAQLVANSRMAATLVQLYMAPALAETGLSVSHSGRVWKETLIVRSKQIPARRPWRWHQQPWHHIKSLSLVAHPLGISEGV